MKYSWKIDQRAAIESGFEIDIIDLSIFELLKDFASEPGCKKMNENGHTYYLFSWKLVTQQQQILGLNTKRSVTRRFEKLSECGIIYSHPDNKSLKMMWYRFGEGAVKLLRSTRNENDLTMNNGSYSLGTTIPSTRNNHSYNNTIKDNTIKDKREEALSKIENQQPNQPTPPLPPPPCSAAPPPPDQDWVSCQAHLVASLEGEYASLLEGARQRTRFRGPIGPVAGDYCRNIEEGLITGKGLFHLRPPAQPGEHRKWVSRMLSGIERYMSAAVRRENGTAPKITPPAPHTPQSQPITRATAEAARKLSAK